MGGGNYLTLTDHEVAEARKLTFTPKTSRSVGRPSRNDLTAAGRVGLAADDLDSHPLHEISKPPIREIALFADVIGRFPFGSLSLAGRQGQLTLILGAPGKGRNGQQTGNKENAVFLHRAPPRALDLLQYDHSIDQIPYLAVAQP